jgi:two-component system invasion response regulator UvrY
MRILLADDHNVVRKGFKMILADVYPNAEIVEVTDTAEMMEQVIKSGWDIIISDISMPGRSGAEVIKELKQIAPQTPILVLSTHPPEQYALRTIRAGASCYLTKESAPEELIKAIEWLLTGKKYLTTEVSELLAEAVGYEYEEELHKKLTNREFEVLKLIISGKTLTEIAELLSISKAAISANRSRIFKKLQIQTNAELFKYVLEKKLWT